MCGIAGIITFNSNNLSLGNLKLMTDAISHRGPDGVGQWIDDERRVGLAHRRLSIIDLNSSADQPMHYMDRYSIVFNGEIYNYIELKDQLLQKGYVFRTKSDTEVLLALFDNDKEGFLNDLDGMFAFAIWDKHSKTLFCARDRFGEKPFYYYQDHDSFYFASEMKALWAVGIPKNPNEKQVFLYLAYGAQNDVQNPSDTFYSKIHQLEHSHCFVVQNNKISNKKKYWDIDLNNRIESIKLGEAKATFYNLFNLSIKRRLRSDVPVGSSLSGGLDSSSIVTLIDKLKPETQIQKTFSARFDGFVRDEGKYMDMVIARNKVEPHYVFLTPELLNKQLDQVAYHQEEPFGSTSVIAQWEVMKLAKANNVTVLLDGQGADEILAGYGYFFYNYFSSLMLHDRNELSNQKQQYFNLYDQKYDYGRNLMLHSYFPKLRRNIRTIKNKLIQPDYFNQFNNEFLSSFKDLPYGSGFVTDLNKALYNITFHGGLQNLLRYADRNSMAHGREVRLPFLSHNLVEFIFSLPDDMKLHNGWTKFILRESMNSMLPKEICWRKEKVGFEPPKYKSIMPDLVDESKSILTKKGIINKASKLKDLDWEYYQISNLYK
jgi:asparagine synthase (glutamine-hydrolysing)